MASQLGVSQLGVSQLGSGVTEAGDPLNQNVSNSLGLVGVATFVPIVNVIASNTLGLTAGQTLTTPFVVVSAGNVFGFVSSAGIHQFVSVTQYLGFTDRIFIDVTNILGLNNGQRLNQGVNASCSNVMLTTGASVIQAHVAANILGLVNVAGATQLASASNELGFVDVVTVGDNVQDLAITQSIMKQHLSYTVHESRACLEQQYAPLVGSSDNTDFGDVSEVAPVLNEGIVTLTYPPTSPTLTIVLRNPNFGNTDTRTFTRLDRKTRGADRKLFSDPKWAKRQVLQLPMTDICPATDGDIITFLNATLGQIIGLADWEGRNWEGVILSPADVTAQANGFAAALTFEGVVV